MKNSSKLLALGLVLFLGACSAAEGDFLKKVEGKTADEATTIAFGSFSSNGKEFSMDTGNDTVAKAKFVKATDENTAEYSYQASTLIITTVDGETGTASGEVIVSGKAIPLWLKNK